MIRLGTTPAKSEADSAVLRAKPDNAVASMILTGEILLLSCRSTHQRLPPNVITERWTGPLHGGLIRPDIWLRRAYLRFRIGHLGPSHGRTACCNRPQHLDEFAGIRPCEPMRRVAPKAQPDGDQQDEHRRATV